MSSLSLRLPDSIHRHLKRAADVDGISINQFINLAVAEKLSKVGWCGSQCGGTEVISASDWSDEDSSQPIGAST